VDNNDSLDRVISQTSMIRSADIWAWRRGSFDDKPLSLTKWFSPFFNISTYLLSFLLLVLVALFARTSHCLKHSPTMFI
jgi:hypothetical protein